MLGCLLVGGLGDFQIWFFFNRFMCFRYLRDQYSLSCAKSREKKSIGNWMPSGCVQEAPMAPNEMTHHRHCREPHSNSFLPQLFVIDLKSLRHLPYAESPDSLSLCRMSQQYLNWDRIERMEKTHIPMESWLACLWGLMSDSFGPSHSPLLNPIKCSDVSVYILERSLAAGKNFSQADWGSLKH